MLDALVESGWMRPQAVVGIFPANRVGDDIQLFTDDERTTELACVRTLRQQGKKSAGAPNRALADFIAPTGVADYLGMFVVTTGHGVAERVEAYKRDHDDYNAIMLEALADRLAEAFAERLHRLVRTNIWGYAPDESTTLDDLVRERFRGIRPAPGYPACPDHSEKGLIFDLLSVTESIGAELTESFAIAPAASVSGYYFAHQKSAYFGIGKLGEDQVADYAARKGWTVAQAERWLAPNLGYTPASN